MTQSIQTIKCKCEKELLSISWIDNYIYVTGACNRLFFCPVQLKKKYNCVNCSHFSDVNLVRIICPFCKTNIDIFAPLIKTMFTPVGHDKNMPEGISNSEISIESISFEKDKTIIHLTKEG